MTIFIEKENFFVKIQLKTPRVTSWELSVPTYYRFMSVYVLLADTVSATIATATKTTATEEKKKDNPKTTVVSTTTVVTTATKTAK